MSTYSDNLRIELIGAGEQAGNWGNTTNDNLATVLEAAIAGGITVAVASSAQALTYVDGPTTTASANQAVRAILTLTTSTSANFAVYAPPVSKIYLIYNASSYTATIYNSTVIGNTTAAGTGVAIAAGSKVLVWSDGTNFNEVQAQNLTATLGISKGGTGQTTANAAFNALAPSQTSNAGKYLKTDGTNTSWDQLDISTADITGTLAITNGGTGSTTASNARTALGVAIGTDVQAYDADLTAIGALAKTDGNFIVGNGTTWVAESGSTARTSLGLGSIATQNSSSVSITGGSISSVTISGITDLAVADGGTGASTLTANAVLLGNGTSAIQAVSPSTSGNVLTSNGTTWVSSTPTPGVPSGAVMSFAMSTVPTGWLECNGAAVSRTTYADLFAAIGTTYGSGNGSTTFNLPDLRGEFVRGWDHGRGVDSGRALGSSQTGTSVLTTGGSPMPVTIGVNTENTYSGSTDKGGWASYQYGSSATYGYVRPRNIALMYCIKT